MSVAYEEVEGRKKEKEKEKEKMFTFFVGTTIILCGVVVSSDPQSLLHDSPVPRIRFAPSRR